MSDALACSKAIRLEARFRHVEMAKRKFTIISTTMKIPSPDICQPKPCGAACVLNSGGAVWYVTVPVANIAGKFSYNMGSPFTKSHIQINKLLPSTSTDDKELECTAAVLVSTTSSTAQRKPIGDDG